MEKIKSQVTELLVNSRGAEGISFRPLTVEDAEDVYDIFSQDEVFEQTHWRPASMEETHRLVRTWLAEKTDVHLVMEHEGQTRGIFRMNAFSPEKREIWLSLIIIKPGCQNRGLGTAATRQAAAALEASGMFDRMLLGVDAESKAAVKCFKKAGFKITERTTKRYSNVKHPVKRFIMSLQFAAER
jgi:RimJ/RimL family protein N-acetyltransferase